MNLPDGYRSRAPTDYDLDAVGDLLLVDQLDVADQALLGADFIREQWSWLGFDLSEDAWVVHNDEGTIVAYGQVRLEGKGVAGSWGVVHPDHRGRAIGSSLLDRIEARASELLAGVASPRFRHSIDAGNRTAASLLSVRGLRPVRHFWHMQIALARPIEPGPAPEGIEIGGIGPRYDLKAIYSVLGDAIADDWRDHPGGFDRWAEEEMNGSGYDPTLWLLAHDGETPVGALTASAGDDGGSVDWLAVLASHRGRGIGTALLRHSFATFAARRVQSVMVSVDSENSTGATAVYERAGMRVANRWDLWERFPGT